MIINFKYIAFSLENIFSKNNNDDHQFKTIALRVQCELHLVNSIGCAVSEHITPIQSHLIIIDRELNNSSKIVPLKFDVELPIEETLKYSPFCNYTYICLFKIIDENCFSSNESVLGYSLLPLINVKGYVSSSNLKVPIISNYSETICNHMLGKRSEELYQFMFFDEDGIDIFEYLNRIKSVAFGFISLTLKINESINYFYFEKNIGFDQKFKKKNKNKYNLKSLLNLIDNESTFFKFQEYKQRYEQMSINSTFSTRSSFLSETTCDILSLNKKNVFNVKEIELQLSIRKLYLSYLTKCDKELLKCEIEFLWKYRHLVINFSGGFPLLIHYLNLEDPSIAKEIKILIDMTKRESFKFYNMKKNILSIEDSLNLLSRNYKEFDFIRIFAIDNLFQLNKQELKIILPQLVQSLRYENKNELSDFLKENITGDFELCIELFWLLVSETSIPGCPMIFQETIFNIIDKLVNSSKSRISLNYNQELHCCSYHQNLDIIDILLCQMQFRNTLLWLHRVSVEECKRERVEKKLQQFQKILCELELGNINSSLFKAYSYSSGIDKIITKLLVSLKYMVENENELIRDCKKKNSNKILHSSKIIWREEYSNLNLFVHIEDIGLPIMNITNLSDPLPLPIDINKALISIVPNESFIIKSSLCPFILSCRMAIVRNPLNHDKNEQTSIENEELCVSESIYRVVESKYMYKVGDDLRQDRLVIQLLEISYKLLQEWNIKEIITTYRILPFSQNDGLIGFLENFSSIGSIRKKYGRNCILQFWAAAHKTNVNSIPQSVMNTFILSCAAYSVITFILGVGDRHLDNLLVGTKGHFLHVDFGYIFGEDPKPFPPPMKICTEMIEAMGGLNSYGFKLFVDKCCEFYRYIRRKSWLIINLLILMIDSGIKDLSSRSDNNYISTLEKIKEKFKLELSEIAAEEYLREIIMTSSKALFPAVVDTLHDWALYWA